MDSGQPEAFCGRHGGDIGIYGDILYGDARYAEAADSAAVSVNS